ncbi:hypothetical protein G3I59_08125 [Amycolatopsis rubida]|uniref:Uncharacterized protein n=1 Tax=Amycolatopsis rubida TaxID=112413 RepID=A0ABX0BJ99_9PSEU|nr:MULTISPECIES: hypothetical protein [Amycolatopsis]MYW90586.1 hypothetical protein [Amycolatopsis rubida]NEC55567.1 hypothetical protein [Amycolatopsis rubida]
MPVEATAALRTAGEYGASIVDSRVLAAAMREGWVLRGVGVAVVFGGVERRAGVAAVFGGVERRAGVTAVFGEVERRAGVAAVFGWVGGSLSAGLASGQEGWVLRG